MERRREIDPRVCGAQLGAEWAADGATPDELARLAHFRDRVGEDGFSAHFAATDFDDETPDDELFYPCERFVHVIRPELKGQSFYPGPFMEAPIQDFWLGVCGRGGESLTALDRPGFVLGFAFACLPSHV